MSSLFTSSLILFQFYENLWAVSDQENILCVCYNFLRYNSKYTLLLNYMSDSCEKEKGLRALFITEFLAIDFLFLDVFVP